MGKVIKVREIGNPVLEKICDKVDIKNIELTYYNENGEKIIKQLKN